MEQCAEVCESVGQYVEVWGSVRECGAVCESVGQCAEVCGSV